MNKRLFITLALVTALTCTACGKTDNNQSPVTSAIRNDTVTTSYDNIAVTTPQTTHKDDKIPITTTSNIPINTTIKAVIDTTVITTQTEVITAPTTVTSEAITTQSATTVSTSVETTQPETTNPAQLLRPVGSPPSPDDPDYAPAPIQYNIEGITYIQGALIANKSYSLPSNFNPGLDKTCQTQFNKMVNDAYAKEGLQLKFGSGFRSYNDQYNIYNNFVARDGQAAADSYSARAGYSEHQSGLAIDVNTIDHTFDGTPEAAWLENHCHEYGFILRYPQGKENITGYQYESWHIRYLGTDLSYAVHNSGLTLEEYFGIDSYYH